MGEKILVSDFNGILIYLEKEVLNEQQIFYNILAKYKYSEATYTFDGELASGKFPRKQETFVKAWILLREEEIKASLSVWQNDNEILKIDGLK